MFHKLLFALCLLFFSSVAMAQPQPQPVPSPAPAPTPTPVPSGAPDLDAPQYWQIHNANGPMDLKIYVDYMGFDGLSDVYYLTTVGTLNGEPFESWGVAFDDHLGFGLRVYNDDSGLWTMWEWKDGHYDKVGGTANRRSYYPVF